MSAILRVRYELLDSDLKLLTKAALRFQPSALIDDLRRGVLQDNSHTFLRGYDHNLLDVYPPGSDIEILKDRTQALDPLETFHNLISPVQNLIVVARSPPVLAGSVDSRLVSNPENKILKLRRMLDPQVEIDQRVIHLIKKRDRFLRRLDVIEDQQDALEMYQDAQRTFGTSTKNNIIASHGDLKINGEFEIPQESSSMFYLAWAAGVPCILKFPDTAAVARHESNVCAQITDPRKRNLVDLELIQFHNLPPRHASQNCALKMPRYTSTLHSCAQGLELGILFQRAAIAVYDGLGAMHTANYCHLDVKPGNIFIDSSGQVYLGDFDAALNIGQTVTRTTPTFLPREMAVLQVRGLLVATPAVDFGMLACTLMYMLDPNYHSSPSVVELDRQAQSRDLNGFSELSRILLECMEKLREDPQIGNGVEMYRFNRGREAPKSENPEIGSESTCSGLEPLL